MKSSCLLLPLAIIAASSCGTGRKLDLIRDTSMSAAISMTEDNDVPELSVLEIPRQDTMVVEDLEGNKVMIMKAVKDENGEMVATDVIRAAIVTSKFRNVAERHGKVDLRFRITVPREMQDGQWQLRFSPQLRIMDETTPLLPVYITGDQYRLTQLKGYERYRKFLDSIVSDTTKFIDTFQLEMFLRRNIPSVYKFRNDSSIVSEADFASAFGVTQRQAIDHYMDKFRLSLNRRKREQKGAMFRKYVKVPLVEEGLRLDTVICSGNGEIIYDYVQTINTRPKLKKAEIVLSGDIFEQEKKIYSMPPSEPLTFYISSIGGLVDEREKYLTRIMERKVELNTACYIDFKVNSSDIIASMGKNSDEIARIKANFVSLMQNEEFDLDSVVVKASCSPEGSFSRNRRLSKERSDAVSKYFNSFMKHWSDSVAREDGLVVDMDGRMSRERMEPVRFISRSDPENWRMLDALISKDSVLTEGERKKYASLSSIEDPDSREMELRSLDNYRYIREKLYPRLRTVRFDFHLHRKGMLQDTVKTTVIDSVYMAGVKAIKDSDYEKAVQLLRPYKDFNSALAYCAMDYNATALKILESIDRTDKVNYMLAILYSRRGDYRSAVECYLRACSQNRHFVHRGNLDPEISDLIKKYGLNKEEGI